MMSSQVLHLGRGSDSKATRYLSDLKYSMRLQKLPFVMNCLTLSSSSWYVFVGHPVRSSKPSDTLPPLS